MNVEYMVAKAEALDKIADYLAERDEWNGADALEFIASTIKSHTGRDVSTDPQV